MVLSAGSQRPARCHRPVGAGRRRHHRSHAEQNQGAPPALPRDHPPSRTPAPFRWYFSSAGLHSTRLHQNSATALTTSQPPASWKSCRSWRRTGRSGAVRPTVLVPSGHCISCQCPTVQVAGSEGLAPDAWTGCGPVGWVATRGGHSWAHSDAAPGCSDGTAGRPAPRPH